MRNALRLAALLAFLVVLPGASATDLTGTWKGAFDFDGTSVPVSFHLTASGNAVTGTVEGLQTSPAEVHDGKVNGDTITFWLNTAYQGQTYKLVYKGRLAADQIEFTFGTDDGGWSSAVTAKKSEDLALAPSLPVLAGVWKGTFEFHDNLVPLTFHLTASGSTVTGTVEGLPETPLEVHDGKVDGDTVSFSVTTEYQGSPVKLVYTGKVSAGQIEFKFGTEDGSWGTVLTATKGV